jgi:hypothetical protein
MRIVPFAVVAALLVGPLAGSTVADTDDAVYAQQLDAKAASVVVLKLVTKIGEFENASERIGTLIDPSGVVMTTGLGSARGGAKVTLVSARVVFPGDEKEYDAILGAFDSRLGLAFFRIKDTTGRAIAAVNPSDAGEVKIGDELFGVSRLEDGFDYAPFYGTVEIVGQVKKPRDMWLPAGGWALASPLFTGAGKFAGVMIQQQGVSDGPRWSKNFLLPASAAQVVIAQGVKASAKALEEMQAKEKEEAAGGAAPKKDESSKPAAPAPMDDGAPGGTDDEGK